MKKIIMGIIVLMCLSIVSATFPITCGDEICVLDETIPTSPFYCPADCENTCSDMGYIMPPDCLDYGYHLDCDSCCPDEDCPECPSGDCIGICIDTTSRSGISDFCEGEGFCPPAECGVCTAEECGTMGYILPPIDGDCTIEECRSSGFIIIDECPDDDCPVCQGDYEECDSCCAEQTKCPFQWWLLVIGGIIGYFIRKNKNKRG